MSKHRKTAELVISDNQIAELRTPADYQFLSNVLLMPDVVTAPERDIHHVPADKQLDVLELANQHFKLTVRKLCQDCAWFGRSLKAKCADKCAHLGNGADLFLF